MRQFAGSDAAWQPDGDLQPVTLICRSNILPLKIPISSCEMGYFDIYFICKNTG
jgi:hypothetical protein